MEQKCKLLRLKPWAFWVLSLEAGSVIWEISSYEEIEIKSIVRSDSGARFTASPQRLECDSPSCSGF